MYCNGTSVMELKGHVNKAYLFRCRPKSFDLACVIAFAPQGRLLTRDRGGVYFFFLETTEWWKQNFNTVFIKKNNNTVTATNKRQFFVCFDAYSFDSVFLGAQTEL